MKRLHLWSGLVLWGVIVGGVFGLFPRLPESQARAAAAATARLAFTQHVSDTAAPLSQASWAPDADTYSIAWGDMDGDGDLDLALGNVEGLNKVYRNEGGVLQETPAWQSAASDYTSSLAWGDMDNDGDLDLAVGNCGNLVNNESHNTYVQVYLNDHGMLQSTPIWTSHYDSNSHRNTRSVAWGDVNGDGYLDLAVGNSGYQNDRTNAYNQVYLNVNGMLAATPAWTSGVPADTRSVAWGDADGDGDLDLAVANIQQRYDPAQGIQIYLNVNGTLQSTPAWTAPSHIAYGNDVISVAWADYGYNDGRLELVAGYASGVVIYENYGTFPSFYDRWSVDLRGGNTVHSVALGDADNDGDLDIAVGTASQTLIYLTGAEGYPAAEGQVVGNADTRSVAWGDVDGDGDLDLAMGNVGAPSQLYDNPLSPYTSTYSGYPCFTDSVVTSLALGDVDNDGDADLAVGIAYGDQPNVVYRSNDDGTYSGIAWTAYTNTETSSLAWGDVDNDGDLDLAVGNLGRPNMVYCNQGGTLQSTPCWTAPGAEFTYSVAWGDLDGDDDLDLAVGGNQTVVYPNLGTTLAATPIWTDPLWGTARSVAWGDVDGDGDLDLATGIGNASARSRVYLNVNGRLQTTPVWRPDDPFETYSVAWGDVDGDGDLDLALGYLEQPNRLYLNQNGRLQTRPTWLAARSEGTWALQWVDAEMDGDLDLMAGTSWTGYFGSYETMLLYQNLGSALRPRAVTLPTTGAAIAWGNLNGDRLPDGVGSQVVYWCAGEAGTGLTHVMSRRMPAHPLYPALPAADLTLSFDHLTPATGYATTHIWGQEPIPFTYTLASDGDSPIMSGYYSLNGGGKWYPAQPTTDTITRDLVILGQALAFNGADNQFYATNASSPLTGGDFTIEFWFNSTQVAGAEDHWEHGMGLVDSSGTVGLGKQDYGVALGAGKVLFGVGGAASDTVLVSPFAADGRWHYVAATRRAADGAVALYLDGDLVASGVGSTQARWQSYIFIGRSALGSNFYQGQLDEIRLWNSVLTPEEIQTSFRTSPSPGAPGLAAYYRGNEAAQPGTAVYFLKDSSPNHNTLTYGSATRSAASLEYVYRWDVLGGGFLGQSDNVIFRLLARPGLQVAPDGIPGPYQRPAVGASTPPLRVRGSQVRVLQNNTPVAGAMVYRIPLGQQTQAGTLYMDLTGQPYRTNRGGYLGGYGEMDLGDQLVALAPITATDTYTLYYTSAAPAATGLDAHTVLTPGVQTLNISATNSLVLFPLEVSLEWDARSDAAFLEQLNFDLRRASEFLYDWSNGQVALGAIHIYHAREHWDTAAVRIYASNRMRPSAIQGGVTRARISDPANAALFYEPGQVRLGASWTRFGEAGSTLAEDWPRALAHELGHYLLYLDDNYLGFDAAGTLIPVDTCSGAMADPYRGDFPYDEFHAADAAWTADCSATLSQQRTARSDWATLSTFYPLHFSVNVGPATLPLAVTQVYWHTPVTPTAALADPTFYLMADGARLQPGTRARAFLFQETRLTDLGSPRLDRVLARGARVGDRLCVLQADTRQVGCEIIGVTDRQLELTTYADWQPDIIITPSTSRTLHISVTQVITSLILQAQLYPDSGEVTVPQTLTLGGATYQGVFTTTMPVIAGHIQLWEAGLGPGTARREAITDFALGGNPASGPGAWSGAPGSGAWSGTPTLSSDGQVSLYGRELVFPEGEFYALQATTALPQLPAWATIVGQAYRLLASRGAPPLDTASISFQYLGREVPAGEESWLAIYHWDGEEWGKLPTTLDLDYNTAVAPVAGPGLYALLASLEIPLPQAGWNLFAYPVQASRPVTEALLSIQEVYTTVYGYEAGAWLIYDKTLPPLLNSLHTLDFGRGYWISVTHPITLNLKGAGTVNAPLSTLPLPPASFYGPVQSGPGFAPVAGMAVTAWAEGQVCGQGSVREIEGQLLYLVHVEASCASPGTTLRFQVGDHWMTTTTSWSAAGVTRLPLRAAHQLFLPLVWKTE